MRYTEKQGNYAALTWIGVPGYGFSVRFGDETHDGNCAMPELVRAEANCAQTDGSRI